MANDKQQKAEQDRGDAVASEAENARLAHTDGGITTRDDVTDLGVPMQPGDPAEPQGPEDALGPGPKRGDYTRRVGADAYEPHVVVPRPDAKPGEPQVEVISQREYAEEIGDAPRRKGGVETYPEDRRR